jgi:hypothetical protein
VTPITAALSAGGGVGCRRRRLTSALRQRNACGGHLAKRALSAFWGTLDFTKPEAARDALLEFMPQLVTTYGQAAATVAADWYETVRARDVAGSYAAKLADAARVRAGAEVDPVSGGCLFTDNPGTMLLSWGGGAAVRGEHVAGHDPGNAFTGSAKPTYARVPQGKTCAFCTLLASRGFVYATRSLRAQFDKYHNDCDCTVVATFTDEARYSWVRPGGPLQPVPVGSGCFGCDGYQVDRVRDASQHPDLFTDGVASD